MDATDWIQYFINHRQRRDAECYAWDIPPPDVAREEIRRLAGSLAIFQLGESGGGSRLRRYADALTASHPEFTGYGRAVELFIAEENGHAGLLRHMVLRLGGRLLEEQWSNSVFRFVRNVLGLEFNVQVLLSAELIARGYYGILSRHAPDEVIRAACGRITRDEAGHIAFHVWFFRGRLASWPGWRAFLWRLQFRVLFAAACAVVWWDHGLALRGCGISRAVFRGKTGRACGAFLAGVSAAGNVRPVSAGNAARPPGEPSARIGSGAPL